MKIIFIRHGKTLGNLEKRYIGRTDESLCDEGIKELNTIVYEKADVVISSPKKRCVQTAKIIYQDCSPVIYEDLKETDFGNFEGKNYLDLKDNLYYKKWIDSNGTLPFPNGESIKDFKSRTITAFEKAVSDFNDKNTLAFVIHGGSIMAIMEYFNKGPFYDYHVKNGHGFITDFNGEKIIIESEI